jgi:hypothetical protein
MTARKLSGVIPMINKERDELRRALGRRAAAESALESARAATDRARAFLEEVVRLFEDHEAASMRASSSLVEEMKAAIASGGTPSADANNREMAKSDVARTALDARRQAAEQVVADLAAEEREREREMAGATAAVEQAVRDILRAEVEKIVACWVEVEREARALRILLGCQSDPVWTLAGLSDAGRRATYQNQEDGEFDLRQRQVTSGPWTDFSAALIRDADARLDFTAADCAIEEMRRERVERREENERYLARMRGAA